MGLHQNTTEDFQIKFIFELNVVYCLFFIKKMQKLKATISTFSIWYREYYAFRNVALALYRWW